MADDADRANALTEAELDRVVAAARGIKPQPSTRCRDCEDPLPAHRREFGTCYLCQVAREMRANCMGAGR